MTNFTAYSDLTGARGGMQARHADRSRDDEAAQDDIEGAMLAGVRESERRPIIASDEVTALAYKYGTPRRLLYSMQADDYIYSYRWRKDSDRRAEVVFAIEDPSGHIWVHAKPHYPAHIFRLPSGGVFWDEAIETALLREVQEETGLNVRIERFLGLLEYTFYHSGTTAEFASYVFHLSSQGGQPTATPGETISAFRPVPPGQISELAIELRNLMGDRRGWGQWRALAHDLVYDALFNQSLSGKGGFVC